MTYLKVHMDDDFLINYQNYLITIEV